MSKAFLPIGQILSSMAVNRRRKPTVLAAYGPSLLGGMLIGLSTAMLFVLNGRIAGITGIAANLGQRWSYKSAANLCFVIGLLLGAPIYRLAFGSWPVVEVIATPFLVVIAGFLVGFGSRLGSGCTSGHGVAGLSRLSPRSIVAVLTFVGTAMVTVFIIRSVGQ